MLFLVYPLSLWHKPDPSLPSRDASQEGGACFIIINASSNLHLCIMIITGVLIDHPGDISGRPLYQAKSPSNSHGSNSGVG